MSTTTQTSIKEMRGKTELITVIIVGAGNRSNVYLTYAEKHPKDLRIVGVVEPD